MLIAVVVISYRIQPRVGVRDRRGALKPLLKSVQQKNSVEAGKRKKKKKNRTHSSTWITKNRDAVTSFIQTALVYYREISAPYLDDTLQSTQTRNAAKTQR